MNLHHTEDEALQQVQKAIRQMRDEEPPDILVDLVMRSVRESRLPWWSHLLRWSKSPRSITITPMRLIPVAALLIALTLGGLLHVVFEDRARTAQQDSRVPVVLALHVPDAKSVAVIGSFNGWQAQKCELRSVNGEPYWTLTLLLPSGRYEYAFLVDGEKIVPDPGAGLREDDGFGSQNAILLIGNGNGSSI